MNEHPYAMANHEEMLSALEELLWWCDPLAAQLHQTRTLGAHLLESTPHHLLAA